MSKFNLDRVYANFQQMKRVLPVKLANASVNYFTGTFKAEAFDGKDWQEVQRRIPGTKPYRYPKSRDLGRRTRNILIGKGSGRLRRAVQGSLKAATWQQVKLVVDGSAFPYAKRHNEGLDNMPKRTFMADAKQLQKKQIDIINKEIDNIWR